MKQSSTVLNIIIKLLSGYYIVQIIFLLLIKLFHPSFKTKLYIKETFHLNQRRIEHARMYSQFIFGTIGWAVVVFVILNNFSPFGTTFSYNMEQKDKNISALGPKDRVQEIHTNGTLVHKQSNDLIYFTTKMPYHFDTATVTITYKNPYPDEDLSIGFQDKEGEWHYSTKNFDIPLFNTLQWSRIGSNPTLYQRDKRYTSVTDFLSHPPKDSIIGFYDLDTSTIPSFRTVIPNYSPQKEMTIIDTPLRGNQTLFAYVKNEPFIMKVTKQDLNWYEGIDPVSINIYKEGDLVYHADIPDDGVSNTSRKETPPQEIEIHNPGPGLPEPGVYKIVINAPGDTVIKKIETNLHKIVFQGPIFPVNNSAVYPQVTASTSATTLYTNALSLSAQTYHPQSLQTIWVGNTPIRLTSTHNAQTITPQENLSTLTIPKNDVVINGLFGYFSLNPSEFFTPSPYFTMPISNPDDIDLVDYILTDYTLPGYENGWYVATKTFDLSSAAVQDGKLSWVIRAPGLKKNNRSILIKDVEVTLNKKPLIKFRW